MRKFALILCLGLLATGSAFAQEGGDLATCIEDCHLYGDTCEVTAETDLNRCLGFGVPSELCILRYEFDIRRCLNHEFICIQYCENGVIGGDPDPPADTCPGDQPVDPMQGPCDGGGY